MARTQELLHLFGGTDSATLRIVRTDQKLALVEGRWRFRARLRADVWMALKLADIEDDDSLSLELLFPDVRGDAPPNERTFQRLSCRRTQLIGAQSYKFVHLRLGVFLNADDDLTAVANVGHRDDVLDEVGLAFTPRARTL